MESTTLGQSVDLLGFLGGQLSGLQGTPTLCYELIQNADDVRDNEGNPGASKIIFDVCDDALYVENDGVFRDIDFKRMQKVAWGNKRNEAGTTGAFGIGFISVYQITDSPEIFSSGQHWKFHPEASETERINVRRVETQFTRFRLPWAFEVSQVRQELNISPVDKSKLDEFAAEVSEVISIAALFLKQVKHLEVKRSGKSLRRIQTEREGDLLLVEDESVAIKWRILEGDFSSEAADMRRRHGSLIEEKRKSSVTIAVPEVVNDKGLLYAFLPSETRTGLPFHVNADFYPSSDRKRILFDVGYKSEWNNIAIKCAATTFAAQLDTVLELYPPEQFWELVDSVKHASESDLVSPAFSSFWQELKQQIRIKPTVLTVGQQMLPPTSTYYPQQQAQADAAGIFEELGLPILHPSLVSYKNTLTDKEVGVQILKVSTVARALKDSGLTSRIELENIPQPSLRTRDGWVVLVNALNSLRESASQQEKTEGDNLLRYCSIAFGSDNALWCPTALFQANSGTQEIFSCFSNLTWFFRTDPNSRLPGSLVPSFGVQDGVKILEENLGPLPNLWKTGKYSPSKIYDWFDSFSTEIASNLMLQEKIRSLAIWPVAGGFLKPLKDLYLAGDFEDPLHLTNLIDTDALEGKREFLEQTLHAQKLDFVTYVRNWLPAALKSNQLTAENRHGLIQVLAEYLGKLRAHSDLQQVLADFPLIWCGGEIFMPASEVYFDSESIKDVLGPLTNIAFLPQTNTDAVRALYEWLGVVLEPRPADIMARIKELTSSAPQLTNVKSIEAIFAYLANQWNSWSDDIHQRFFPLKEEKWLPGTKNQNLWFAPKDVYSIYQNYLFESQGNFLKIDRAIQQKGSELIKYLGIESEPSARQVVQHLLYVSEQEKPVNQQVYTFLNRFPDDQAIRLLKNKSCLYLKSEDGSEKYFRPDQVFWEDHPFGRLRFRLGPEFGQYKDLFDRLGVKEKPDYHDAIQVLLEIADEFGSSNIKLDDKQDIKDVVLMSWKLLTTALESGQVTAQELASKVGHKKTILDSRNVLDLPVRLFFEDRPGWGVKFEILKNNLIPRIEGAWGAMEAAGVQRVSNAITIEIHQCENRREDIKIKSMLTERKGLIQRVVDAYKRKDITDFALQRLDEISYVQADQIEVVKTFTGFNRREVSDLEKIDSIYLENTLYISFEKKQYTWSNIARELAYVLHPSGELSSLGMELKEILSQSIEEASLTLDEFGYPRIVITNPPPTTGSGVVELGGESIDSPDFGDDTQTDADVDVPDQLSTNRFSQNSQNAPVVSEKSGRKKSENRKTSRLVSYVLPKKKSEDQDAGEFEPDMRRNEIGQIGVNRVMEFEKSQGRDPIDMETIQVHHPGYDITATDASQNPRYIEVKSFTGIWDSQNPAQMTKREFETAREKGEKYWLYIVEKVETDDFKIYRICNPANQVDAYLFDHGWIHLADNKGE